jgi:hypothetical protein
MFRIALGREPTGEELDRWGAAVGAFAALHGVSRGECLDSAPVWADAAHVIFNLKEFIYVR